MHIICQVVYLDRKETQPRKREKGPLRENQAWQQALEDIVSWQPRYQVRLLYSAVLVQPWRIVIRVANSTLQYCGVATLSLSLS